MVRKYKKQNRNRYVKRTRLTELEFLLVLRCYGWLFTANETLDYIQKYAEIKSLDKLRVSRVTINKLFKMLNDRVSMFVESGHFMGSSYPYGLIDLDNPEKRNATIENYITLFHSVLSEQVPYEKFKRIYEMWRRENIFPHFETYHWDGIKLLWAAMRGINRSELRGQYNRVAFACFFIDRNMDQPSKNVSRKLYEYLASHLEENPL